MIVRSTQILIVAAVVATVGAGWLLVRYGSPEWGRDEFAPARVAALGTELPRHPIQTRPGPATPTVVAPLPGGHGAVGHVSCSTCHTTRTPNLEARAAADLDEFHQGLNYAHGNLSCLSCHNATNYDTLRRADGTSLSYPNAIQLCAQCHGTHYRDYLHGSHGGASGHWDLTAGPRTRNICLDCHDVHAPAYPQVRPVFPPQDRGALQMRDRDAKNHDHH